MKRYILSLLLCIITTGMLRSQTLSLIASPTNGGYYNAGGNSLSWTIGETYNTTITNGSSILTQGAQQSYKRPTSIIIGTQAICAGATSGNISIVLTGAPPWNLTYTDGTTPVTITGIMASPYTFTVSPASTKTYSISALRDINSSAEPTDRTGSAVVTVNPLPAGSANSIVICDHSPTNLALSSTQSGTTYTWTSSVITGAVGGNGACSNRCGTTISDILTNSGTVHGVVEYSIIPTANGCTGSAFTADVTVGATPAVPAAILGPNAVCQMTTATYSVTAVPEATNYIWTFTPATGSATPTITTVPLTTVAHGGYLSYGNSITVTIPAGTVIGTYTVAAKNNCGTSGTVSLSITKKPGTPGAIQGPLSICGATTAIYKVAAVQGATSYTWTLPTGITIANGTGTDSINVNIASTFVTGNISVTAVNACGSIPGTLITVYAKAPAAPSAITGPAAVCGVTTATYVSATLVGATGFIWTVPAGISITGGQGSNTITVQNLNFTSGSISVSGINTCGIGAVKTLALSVAAAAPLAITGPAMTCGLTSAAYLIASVTGSTGYNWTVPAGATITSGLGTTGITATFTTPITGTVSVTSTNGCTTSAARALVVTKSVVAPGAITGQATALCALGTATFTTAGSLGATGYTWFVPAGMNIISGQETTSINANVTTTLTTGSVKVNAQNTCGSSLSASYAVSCLDPIGISSGAGAELTSFSIYPNPATNEFTIAVGNLQSSVNNHLTIEMVDMLGKIVMKSLNINTQTSINIEQLNKGMYFVKLIDGNGDMVYTQRVIKE